jgi:hypothetical protein
VTLGGKIELAPRLLHVLTSGRHGSGEHHGRVSIIGHSRVEMLCSTTHGDAERLRGSRSKALSYSPSSTLCSSLDRASAYDCCHWHSLSELSPAMNGTSKYPWYSAMDIDSGCVE